jgi:hypothetical protein
MEAVALSQKCGTDEGIWIEIEGHRARIGALGESASE